jgi:hypothetical protein
MFRTNGAFCVSLLALGCVLAVAGCGSGANGGGAAKGGGNAGGAATTAGVAPPATAGSTAGAVSGTAGAGGANTSACSGGLTGAEPGVIRVVCGGPATIRVQAGPVNRQFAGGQCEHAGDMWSATVGVITEAGVYKGPPVDVVSVNKDSGGGGTIQLNLGRKVYFVEGASFKLSDGGKAAHLHGTTTSLPEPGVPVTVDVAC